MNSLNKLKLVIRLVCGTKSKIVDVKFTLSLKILDAWINILDLSIKVQLHTLKRIEVHNKQID